MGGVSTSATEFDGGLRSDEAGGATSARHESARSGVLSGLTVLDLTEELAGPVATRLLAEVGADVVKVEPPHGDVVRGCCPAAFATWNRSKTAITLDVTQDTDSSTLDELLAVSDVVVHNFTPCQASQRGLDDDSLARRFPKLIVASVTGYPPGHPDAERVGDEILVQARLGAMDEQQALREGPMFVRMPFASWCAAYLLAAGIVVRLLERHATGLVHPIHTSLLQGALVPAALYWHRAESPPAWMVRHALRRDDHPSNLTIFQCADGRWIHLLGGFSEAAPIRTVLESLGRLDLAGTAVTVDNRPQWSTVLASKTVDEWTRLLWPAGVICMPVLDMGEVLKLDQARANRYSVEVEDPHFGLTVQAGFPFEVEPPPGVRRPAPWAPGSTPQLLERLNDVSNHQSASADRPSRSGGLASLRVVDFGSYVAGPMGAQCFADFGAEVIKVEPPWGEPGRTINQFTGCQRGKRSLAIDMRDPEAAQIIQKLVASADVVMHNMRESAARRLGIDESSVRAINPKAVFAHSSAYGSNGPWKDFGAFDPAACALSGWEQHISGPGKRPTWLRNSVMDSQAGLSLFLASVVALYRRAVAGVTSPARTSLLAVAATSSSETLLLEDGACTPFAAIDADQAGISPYYRIYKASDGWIAIAARGDQQQQSLHQVLRAVDASSFAALIVGQDGQELLDKLIRAGVPAELVVTDGRDSFFDRELPLAAGLVTRCVTKDYGWFENPNGFWSDGRQPIRSMLPIPAVGEHTIEILGTLGYSAEESNHLIDDGVVAVGPVTPPSDTKINRLTRSLAINA